MGSFHVHVMCTSIGAMNIPLKRALTPSPSPIRWERVAVRPGEGRFIERKARNFQFNVQLPTLNQPRTANREPRTPNPEP
jgi:hypothetical protein